MDDFLKLLAVVGDAAALAAEREGGADDEREGADFLGDLAGLLHRVGDAGARHVEADFDHRLFEKLAVLALVDGLGLGADHADAVFVERAGFEERHRGVERRLAAERGEQRVGFLADDDFLDDFRRDGLDVSAMRELRIGHDGGRIRVHQDHLVAFFLERLAGLHAGVVELATLADDDGAGADDENFADRGIFGHGGRLVCGAPGRLNWTGFGRDSAACKGSDFKHRAGCEKAAGCVIRLFGLLAVGGEFLAARLDPGREGFHYPGRFPVRLPGLAAGDVRGFDLRRGLNSPRTWRCQRESGARNRRAKRAASGVKRSASSWPVACLSPWGASLSSCAPDRAGSRRSSARYRVGAKAR